MASLHPRREIAPYAGARLLAAVATFALLFSIATVAGHRTSWFPRAHVYRFPKWTPLELGMVDEEIDRTRARAGGRPYAVLIGDSIPHGDGYGRPSESLAARLSAAIPMANLTSPSLAFEPERALLDHVLRHTDVPVVLVQVNLKWISHEWVPEKFTTLLAEIADCDAGRNTVRQKAGALRRRLIDVAVLREPRSKLRYRFSNFTLRGFLGSGFSGGAESLWASEFRQEAAPDYKITDVATLPEDQAKTASQYHRLGPGDVDGSPALRALIDEMRTSPGRVVAVLTPLNPAWTHVLAPGLEPNAAQRHLEAKLRSAGIRVIVAKLDEADYHDDMHLTAAGARKAAAQIGDALQEMTR